MNKLILILNTFLIVIILIAFTSCSGLGGGDDIVNFKPSLYEYNVATKSYNLIKTFGISSSTPYYAYYRNDNNKVIFAQYDKIFIINTSSKKEVIIELDSIMIQDNFFSFSPIENKIVFSAFSTNLDSYRRGLYILDLDNKNIEVLISSNDKQVPEVFEFPHYSSNGNSIVYKTFSNGIRDSTGSIFYGYPSRIYVMDLISKQTRKIYSNENYDLVKYAMFDRTDQNIFVIELPQKLLKVNCSTLLIDTIDGNHYFEMGVYLQGYPNFLITDSKIYYACGIESSPSSFHQIYQYENETRIASLFVNGIMPMSINNKNGNILIRSSSYYLDSGSDIQIVNPEGQIIETLKYGDRAIFSPEGDKVLLSVPEKATSDDY